METENEGNEKNLSVVGVWLLRKLWERMETEKPNPFLGGQIYCLVAEKMKEMEKRMKLFFFLGISESVMNFYLLGPNCCIKHSLLPKHTPIQRAHQTKIIDAWGCGRSRCGSDGSISEDPNGDESICA